MTALLNKKDHVQLHSTCIRELYRFRKSESPRKDGLKHHVVLVQLQSQPASVASENNIFLWAGDRPSASQGQLIGN